MKVFSFFKSLVEFIFKKNEGDMVYSSFTRFLNNLNRLFSGYGKTEPKEGVM